MKHTKANFKALRERVGLSQQDIADMLGVTRTSVKRWERPGFNDPPDDAWELLTAKGETQRAMVDEISERCVSEGVSSLQLTYWRNQEQFDALGRDEGLHTVANANARAIAQELESIGVEVEFSYPDDPDNVYHQLAHP